MAESDDDPGSGPPPHPKPEDPSLLEEGARSEASEPELVEIETPLAGLETPEKYDAARHLGETRKNIAFWLILLLAATLLMPWVAFLLHYPSRDLKDLFSVVSTPVIGLLGAVIGFYFGERTGP